MPRRRQTASPSEAASPAPAATTPSAAAAGSDSPTTGRVCSTRHAPDDPPANVNRRGTGGGVMRAGSPGKGSGGGAGELERQRPGPLRPRPDQLAVLEVARKRAGDRRQFERKVRPRLG